MADSNPIAYPYSQMTPNTRARISMASIVFFLSFLAMSPIFAAVGIKSSLVLVVALAVLLFNGSILGTTFHIVVYILAFLYVLASICAFFYWGSPVPIYFALMYVSTIIVVANIRRKEVAVVVRYATVLLGALIALAWIGFIYSFFGGEAIASIQNPDGRQNFFFLTTFSISVSENYIRPSAIYDEPGAFSFFICALCTLREILKKNRNVTATILIGGVVTLSIAHVIYMVFHFGSYLLNLKYRKSFSATLILVSMMSVILLAPGASSLIHQQIFDRAVQYGTGTQANPREAAMVNVYQEITPERLLLGFGERCVSRSAKCVDEMGGDYGENPLTPLVYGGVLLAWPYYLTILALIIHGLFVPRHIFVVGFALLLLQRPYALEFPYSALVFLVVLTLVYQHHQRSRPST